MKSYSLTPARYRYILLTKDLVNPQDVPLKFVQSFVYSHLLTLRGGHLIDIFFLLIRKLACKNFLSYKPKN